MFDKKNKAKQDPQQGGWMSGRRARRMARRGGMGDDGKVRDPKGRQRGDFGGRKRREPNQHGV